MNTNTIIRSLQLKIMRIEQEKSRQRKGLLPVLPHQQSVSQLIRQIIMDPIIEDIRNKTGYHITYQCGTSTGFYYLLINQKKFAILYIPNPASGKIFIKFLNNHGAQCMSNKLLTDTVQITDYLNQILSNK